MEMLRMRRCHAELCSHAGACKYVWAYRAGDAQDLGYCRWIHTWRVYGTRKSLDAVFLKRHDMMWILHHDGQEGGQENAASGQLGMKLGMERAIGIVNQAAGS